VTSPSETGAEGAILERREGGVVVLTMNAPDKRNALIPPVREGLLAALARLDEDDACRAIVLTGAGGAFCAGGDLSAKGPHTARAVRRMMKRPQRLLRALAAHTKPIIAAVEGPAFGAGFALALACDFVAAGRSASFCAAYGRVGVIPDIGLLWSLPQRVGMGLAREIVMFADVMRAPEAQAKGVIDWLAEDGQAEAAAMERAQRLASGATAAIGLTKALLARAPLSMEMVLAHELEAQGVLSGTDDAREGLLAFAEKRKPQFKGT
jgi:2-(1,2-epoxy-1,2-dihydrophenyl)acetyl-CoA isomerase